MCGRPASGKITAGEGTSTPWIGAKRNDSGSPAAMDRVYDDCGKMEGEEILNPGAGTDRPTAGVVYSYTPATAAALA